MAAALALLVVALVHNRWAQLPVSVPVKILPELRTASVTAIQVRRKDSGEIIRAERTNSVWRLTKPVDYRAQAASIERFLAALDRLVPAIYLSAHERLSHPGSGEGQGLAQPEDAIFVQQGDRTFQLDIGANTPPGDQFYLQVAGDAGVYIVDAEFLKFLPKTKDDWRDRGLLDLKGLTFDRVAVTNGAKVLELQRIPAPNQWQIVNPTQARADAQRLDGLLLQLEAARVAQFVSDSPEPNLDSFGLQPPSLEIALARGTNTAIRLQFGRSPTNEPTLVYARRAGQDTIVTVPTNGLVGWQDSVAAFRDPHLVNLQVEPIEIEVRAEERFSLQRQGTNTWKILPQNLVADSLSVGDLLAVFSDSPIVDVRDAVPQVDLAKYGLAPPDPVRQYVLKAAGPASPATNVVLVELNFGATNDDKVWVRRADEASVYAIKLADFQRLPGAGFQLRPRRLWQYSPDDVERVLITQAGKERQIIHSGIGPVAWSLAPGSSGAINPLAVDQTIKELGQLEVTNWVAHGESNRPAYGLTPPARHLVVQLKNGGKPAVDIGAPARGNSLYGAVVQAGEIWIFEFPPRLAQWIEGNLCISP